MAYKVIILYQLYMPSYFLGTFTEYPWKVNWESAASSPSPYLNSSRGQGSELLLRFFNFLNR